MQVRVKTALATALIFLAICLYFISISQNRIVYDNPHLRPSDQTTSHSDSNADTKHSGGDGNNGKTDHSATSTPCNEKFRNWKSLAGAEADKYALLSLFDCLHTRTVNQTWPTMFLDTWNNTEVNHCKWARVTCNETTGRVEHLGLQDLHLEGTLPDAIGGLTFLKDLRLPNNFLYGDLPESLSNLEQLEVLDLSYNTFNGSIPSTIWTMPMLLEIDLDGNVFPNLFESWPLVTEIAQEASRIERLRARNCQIRGSIPDNRIGKLFPKLKYLDLSVNQIVGEIPSDMGPNLIELQLHFNNLTSISQSFSASSDGNKYPNLQRILLAANQLQDPLGPGLMNLCTCDEVEIGDNHELRGPILIPPRATDHIMKEEAIYPVIGEITKLPGTAPNSITLNINIRSDTVNGPSYHGGKLPTLVNSHSRSIHFVITGPSPGYRSLFHVHHEDFLSFTGNGSITELNDDEGLRNRNFTLRDLQFLRAGTYIVAMNFVAVDGNGYLVNRTFSINTVDEARTAKITPRVLGPNDDTRTPLNYVNRQQKSFFRSFPMTGPNVYTGVLDDALTRAPDGEELTFMQGNNLTSMYGLAISLPQKGIGPNKFGCDDGWVQIKVSKGIISNITNQFVELPPPPDDTNNDHQNVVQLLPYLQSPAHIEFFAEVSDEGSQGGTSSGITQSYYQHVHAYDIDGSMICFPDRYPNITEEDLHPCPIPSVFRGDTLYFQVQPKTTGIYKLYGQIRVPGDDTTSPYGEIVAFSFRIDVSNQGGKR